MVKAREARLGGLQAGVAVSGLVNNEASERLGMNLFGQNEV
jgi:hypothetical protein